MRLIEAAIKIERHGNDKDNWLGCIFEHSCGVCPLEKYYISKYKDSEVPQNCYRLSKEILAKEKFKLL